MKSALLFIIPLAFFGCCEKQYIDRPVEVKVPVKCKAPDVEKAKAGSNDAETLLNIIRERDELREAVEVCK